MCTRVVVPFWINVWESQSLQLIIAFLVSWPVIVLRCISLVTNDVELFYVLLGPPYIFFDEMPIHIFYTFLIEWFFLIFEFWILKSILKSRNITLPIKVHIVKAMVFPVVMYGCESWTIKKASRKLIFWTVWCWRRLLRVPWTARRSKQSILEEISPEYSLEGLMLKLKLQNFGHLMWRTDSLEKTMMLGKIEIGRRRGWQRMR